MARAGSPAAGSGRTIRLLGPVHAEVGGRPLAVDTRKAIALVAYLAVTDRPAARETVAALLWPESDGPAARGALRRTLSVLGAAVGDGGLAVDRWSVALDGRWDVDVRRFRDSLAVARGHGHDPDAACPACLAALEDAAALDRGEFMAGFALRDSAVFDEWQVGEAESHRRELAGLYERLVRARGAAADTAGAITAARRWLELDPLHEPAHRLLMLTLARAGEQAAAIDQYRACVRALDRELGVAPLDETTALYEAIRSAQVMPERRPEIAARPAARRTSAASAGSRSSPPLVGRDAPLDALLRGYRSIAESGRLFVVEGEPGGGKSALVSAFAREIEAVGGRVVESRAYAGESSIPFAPLTGLFTAALDEPDARERLAGLAPDVVAAAARVVPALTDVVRTGSQALSSEPLDALGRARAVESLVAVLAALVSGPRPGVVVVDDADWADDSTTEVLAFLARRLARRPLGLVVTWRPLAADDAERRRLVAAAERANLATAISLERLARDDVGRLASAILGDRADRALVDQLFADSEGLPLYVAELLAAGPAAGVVPRGVLQLLRARIAAVGEVAGQVLAAASVIGRSFDFETVRATSGRSEDETVAGLEELIGRGLVREVGTVDGDVRLDFTHGRLRDVEYDSLGLVRRRLLHRRVADALRARSGGDELARWSRIARHETEAGRTREAAAAHRRAAEQARAVFANREAGEHLETALALDPSEAGAIHAALGDVLTLLGDYAGAIAHLEAAAATVDAVLEWSVERSLARVHARLGDWPRAASHLEAALAAAPDDPRVRSALLADRGAILGRLGDEAAAADAAGQALAIATASADAAAEARASHVLGVLARGHGDVAGAAELLERSLSVGDRLSDPGLRIASLNTLALVRADAGDPGSAIPLLEEALGLCERQGDRHRQAALENNLADLLRAEGRRDEAMEHLKLAVAIFADIGGRPGVPEPEIWKLVEW
jgi:DNA-binding SARP family transcriptional activator/tetratricopeptide (TPR) repeat protein